MRIISKLLFASTLAMAAAVPALADDAPAAPASPFTVTGGATLISDYRFRGISQTNKRFAIQGTLGVSHSSGFYVGTWGSSIDDYVTQYVPSTLSPSNGHQEIDLYAGYKKTFSGTTVDMGLLYYYYPNTKGADSDFFEPYINASHSFGPIGVKVGGNFAWKQHALGVTGDGTTRDGGAYGYGELSFAVPNTGLAITGHVGHSFVKNWITLGYEYTDWSVTAAYTWKALTFSAAYVDASKNYVVAEPGSTRDIMKGGFVGAVAVAF